MREEDIQVICYSGHKLNEKPRKFFYQEREYLIKSIPSISMTESINGSSRWVEYIVEDEYHQIHLLRYYPLGDTWRLVMK